MTFQSSRLYYNNGTFEQAPGMYFSVYHVSGLKWFIHSALNDGIGPGGGKHTPSATTKAPCAELEP